MIYISKKGKEKLEKKLELIDKEIIDTYKKMGESTKIDNDLRENPEYLDLQTKVSYKLPFEKKEIKEILNDSVIIENQDFYKNFDSQTVIIGSKIELLYNDNVEIYEIVGYGDDDPFNNIISYNCDFSKNLIGKKTNEEFFYKNNKIKVLKVELIK